MKHKKYRKGKIYFLLFLIIGSSQSLFGQRVLTIGQALDIAYTNSPNIINAELDLLRSRELLKAENAALKSNFRFTINPLDYSNNRQFFDQGINSGWGTRKNTSSYGSFVVSQPILPTDGTISITNTLTWMDNVNKTNNPDPTVDGDIITSQTRFSNDLYLRLEQPIFTYNRRKLTLKGLELDLENSQLNYEIQKLSIEREVTQSFYNLHSQQMSVQIAKDELDNQEKTHAIIKNKVEAGLAVKEELYQAELNLATSKSSYQNQKVTLENQKDDFKQLIGIPIREEISALADIQFNPVEVDLNKAISYGMDQRMELRQRKIDIERSQFDLIRTNGQNEFKGNVSVTFGLFGDNEKFTNMFESPANNQAVNVSLEIPIYDWGEKKARMKAQRATMKTNDVNLENEKNNILINIRKTHRSLQNLINQVEIAEQNVKNAKLTYEINLERYRNGDLTSMDLNQQQNQLSTKKKDLATALINYKIELLNMKIQTLYDFENSVSIAPTLMK